MSKRTTWLAAAVIVAAFSGGSIWYFVAAGWQNKQAQATTQPSRISKDKDGRTIVTITPQEQTQSGIQVQSLAATSFQPQLIAYGTLQDDPSNSFTLRAPFAGILRGARDRSWPMLGETLAEGQIQVCSIEPNFTPVERVDLTSRLASALADVSTAKSALAAAWAEYDADLKLNAQDENVSDRTLQQARAALDEQTAKLEAARQTVEFLQSALAATTRPAAAIPLTVPGGCQVVDVSAHPNETIDSAQPILRVARFDTLLATVALPAGQNVDPASISARLVALGLENHPLKVQKITVSASVDAKTLGQTLLIQVDTHGLGLRSGEVVTAYLTSLSKPPQGVLVPRDAVVWNDGKAWVYVLTAEDQFVRSEIPTDRPVDHGWFVAAGLSASERVIVQGAQQLLSEEFKPIIPAGGDVDND